MKKMITEQNKEAIRRNGLSLAQFEMLLTLKQEKNIPASWINRMNDYWVNNAMTYKVADDIIRHLRDLPDNDTGISINNEKIGYHKHNDGYVRIHRTTSGRLKGDLYFVSGDYGDLQRKEISWDDVQTYSMKTKYSVSFAQKFIEMPLLRARKIKKSLYN